MLLIPDTPDRSATDSIGAVEHTFVLLYIFEFIVDNYELMYVWV